MTTIRPFTCDDLFTFNNVYVFDYYFNSRNILLLVILPFTVINSSHQSWRCAGCSNSFCFTVSRLSLHLWDDHQFEVRY